MTQAGTSSKVLIVDDQAAMRAVVRAALEPLGYILKEASSGQEAIDVAGEWLPDVVLLDVMMPGISGFEVTRALRAHPVTREIPIIIVTALEDRGTRHEALAAGADEILVKPLDVAEVRLRVQTTCRLNRYRLLGVERARLAALIEGGAVGTVVLDLSGRVLYANARATELLGVSGDEVAPRSRETVEHLLEVRSHAAASGQRLSVSDPPGLPVGTECIIVDTEWGGQQALRVDLIGEHRAAEVELLVRHRERLAAVGQLAASVAHEIASNLAAVEMSAGFLTPDPDAIERQKGLIRAAAQRGTRIARQMMALARPASEQAIGVSGRVLREEILPGLQVILGAGVQVGFEGEDEGRIALTRADLEQALLTLAINSRDAGSTAVTVRLRSLDSGEVELAVADNGRGIDPAIRDRIGEAFVTTRADRGHGLGVWSVRRLVHENGGYLRFVPNENRGTIATITLPRLR